MQAVVQTRTGGPEVLEAQERPEPVLGEGDVRIAVRAAGLNFADTMARAGLYPHAPKPPCVLGYEVSGVVEAVGPACSGRAVGWSCTGCPRPSTSAAATWVGWSAAWSGCPQPPCRGGTPPGCST